MLNSKLFRFFCRNILNKMEIQGNSQEITAKLMNRTKNNNDKWVEFDCDDLVVNRGFNRKQYGLNLFFIRYRYGFYTALKFCQQLKSRAGSLASLSSTTRNSSNMGRKSWSRLMNFSIFPHLI